MPTTLKEFESVFPTLVKDMKEHCQKYKLPEQALKWFEHVGTQLSHADVQSHWLIRRGRVSTTTPSEGNATAG